MEGVTWHQFRHVHSSLLHDLGVPAKVAQQELGHAHEDTTRGYIRPTVRRQVEEVEAMAMLVMGNEEGSVQ